MLTADMEVDAGFQTFADELRSPGQPGIAPEPFAAAMHLRPQDLAQLAHVHRTTVAEAPSNAKLQAFMRDALRVLSAAMAMTGDRDRAIYWYRSTPIPEFKHQTAEHLVSTGRTDAVVSYLQSIESLARRHGVEPRPEDLQRAVEARRAEAAKDPRYRGLSFDQLLKSQGLTVESLKASRVFRSKVLLEQLAARLHPDADLRAELQRDRQAVLDLVGPRRRMQEAGLEVERLTYHTSLLLPAVFAQRMWSRLRRGTGERAEYPVQVPPEPLNRLFYAVMNLERRLLRRVDMPIGSSLVAVCRR